LLIADVRLQIEEGEGSGGERACGAPGQKMAFLACAPPRGNERMARLGEGCGATDYAAAAMVLRRFEMKMKNDTSFRRAMPELERIMFNVKM
jgi:hypothetical protein